MIVQNTCEEFVDVASYIAVMWVDGWEKDPCQLLKVSHKKNSKPEQVKVSFECAQRFINCMMI